MTATPTGVSRTALVIAAWREHESERPDALVWDHLAALFLDAEDRRALAQLIDGAPMTRELIALRTRWFDEAIDAALDRGTRQVVLLGAGLDTRALRLARAGVRFFEVDHAQLLAFKAARLHAHGYPTAATTLACDYVHDDVAAALIEAGARTSEPCLIVWEGNTMYLDERELEAALAPVLTHFSEPTLCLDHVSRRLVERRGDHQLVDGFAELDARWRGGWDDVEALTARLAPLGLRVLDHRELATFAQLWRPHRPLPRELLHDYFVCTCTRV